MSQSVKKLNVLVIEDNPGDYYLLKEYLRQTSLNIEKVEMAETLAKGGKLLQKNVFDVIFLDLSLPDSFGLASVQYLNETGQDAPIIVLTGLSDSSIAIESIKSGAQDYLVKDELNKEMLQKSVQYAIERKQITLALKQSNLRFEQITRASYDMLWEWDLRSQSVYREKYGFERLFGNNTVLDEKPDSWVKWIVPEDAPSIDRFLQDIVEHPEKESFQWEYRMRKQDGDIIYIADNAVVIREKDLKPYKVVGATKNITESKRAEEELRRSEQKFRLLFEKSPCSTFVFDRTTFMILEVNETSLNTYGYSREEFLSKKYIDIRPTEELPFFYEAVQDLSGSQEYEKRVWKHIKKNGEVMLMKVAYYPLEYLGRDAIVSQALEITETIRLKDELASQEKIKQQEIIRTTLMVQEKERSFLGAELHDNINQILTSSKLFLEMGCNTSDFTACRKGIEHLQVAMDEIRKLSRTLVSPGFYAESLEIAVNGLIDIVRTTRDIKVFVDTSSFDEKSINTEKKIALYRIIQEQLNNIIKHADATEVSISIGNDHQLTILTVSDNGKGFDTSQKTNGIGLANISNRATFYNGTVNIYSEPGKGAILTVVLS